MNHPWLKSKFNKLIKRRINILERNIDNLKSQLRLDNFEIKSCKVAKQYINYMFNSIKWNLNVKLLNIKKTRKYLIIDYEYENHGTFQYKIQCTKFNQLKQNDFRNLFETINSFILEHEFGNNYAKALENACDKLRQGNYI